MSTLFVLLVKPRGKKSAVGNRVRTLETRTVAAMALVLTRKVAEMLLCVADES